MEQVIMETYAMEINKKIECELPSGSYLKLKESNGSIDILCNDDCASILMEHYRDDVLRGNEVMTLLEVM